MKRQGIIDFFQHIAAREASYGVQDAFRFKAVLTSRKKGKLLKANYFDEREHAAPEKTVTAEGLVRTELALEGVQDPGIGDEPDSNPAFSRNHEQPGWTPENMLTQLGPDWDPIQDCGPSEKAIGKTPALSLDPAFNFDIHIPLDPELEVHPISNFQSLGDDLLTFWPNPTTGSSSQNISAQDPIQSALSLLEQVPAVHQMSPRRSPRRKARNADSLAMEEANLYVPVRKSRR